MQKLPNCLLPELFMVLKRSNKHVYLWECQKYTQHSFPKTKPELTISEQIITSTESRIGITQHGWLTRLHNITQNIIIHNILNHSATRAAREPVQQIILYGRQLVGYQYDYVNYYKLCTICCCLRAPMIPAKL